MSTKVQIRRGSTSSANAFTGAEGELYVDLGEKSLRVHDGVQQGGFLLAKESELTSKVDKINITAGTVGSGSQIPVITYNEQGQITTVSTSTLNIPTNIATETYVNTQIANIVNTTYSAGTGLSLIGTTFNLSDTAVIPGSYTNANVTVDAQGRITNIVNGGSTSTAGGSSGFEQLFLLMGA